MSPLTKIARPLLESRRTTVPLVVLALPMNNMLVPSNVQSLKVYVVWGLWLIPLLLPQQPMVSSASQYPRHVFRRRVMGTWVSQFVGIGKKLTGWIFFVLAGLRVTRKRIMVSNRSFGDGRALAGILWPNVPDPQNSPWWNSKLAWDRPGGMWDEPCRIISKKATGFFRKLSTRIWYHSIFLRTWLDTPVHHCRGVTWIGIVLGFCILKPAFQPCKGHSESRISSRKTEYWKIECAWGTGFLEVTTRERRRWREIRMWGGMYRLTALWHITPSNA